MLFLEAYVNTYCSSLNDDFYHHFINKSLISWVHTPMWQGIETVCTARTEMCMYTFFFYFVEIISQVMDGKDINTAEYCIVTGSD